MAGTTTTSSVYINVIDDVINKVRDEFLQTGVEESVLIELQGLWEQKMLQCGAITGPIERTTAPPKPVAATGGVITPVHDLNVPYEPTEEYETPTADILFPPTPLQTPMQTPLPGTAEHSMYQLPTPSDYTNIHDTGVMGDVKPGRPSPYMQPPSPWMPQRPLGVDVNVAYEEGRDENDRGTSHQPPMQDFFMSSGKRKREDIAPQFNGGGYIPQQDGAGDTIPEASHLHDNLNKISAITAKCEVLLSQATRNSPRIPQQDGPITDAYEELYPYQGVANEDYNAVNTPAPNDLQARTPAVEVQAENEDDDEPPLNENDDDDFDDVDDQEEDPNTQHLVLAQFDKVTRTKSRWKCTLKDGIMHINNKDILFTKANGEFEF